MFMSVWREDCFKNRKETETTEQQNMRRATEAGAVSEPILNRF